MAASASNRDSGTPSMQPDNEADGLVMSESSCSCQSSLNENISSSEVRCSHICIAMYGPRSVVTTCFKQHSSSPRDLFNCAQAECQVCLNLDWAYFPQLRPVYDEGSRMPPKVGDKVRGMQTTLGQLSASRGRCNSCELVMKGIECFPRRQQELGETNSTLLEDMILGDVPVYITLRDNFSVTLQIVEPSLRDVTLELYTAANVPSQWKAIGPASHIQHSPSVEYVVKFINAKLTICKARHSSCRPSVPSKLPTRVIDVGTSSILSRLVESAGHIASYITLSHCWGATDSEPLKTTTDSLTQHRKAISWNSLSRTFQDVILITRGLGIQYLWIDSLCIIQDSHLDWELESACMAEIYLNSVLTLAATASYDGRGGYCFPRPVFGLTTDKFPTTNTITGEALQPESRITGMEKVNIRQSVDSSHKWIDMGPRGFPGSYGAPLLTRAWAYQENVLSPATVHSHAEELSWECRETCSCECGYFSWLEVANPFSRDIGKMGWKVPYKALHRADSDILGEYNERSITRESDRLPALAGLASRFAEKLNTRYLAGLWESDLWRGLLWRKGSCDSRRLFDKRSRLPTWSWASIARRGNTSNGVLIESIGGFSYNGLVLPYQVDDQISVVTAACSTPTASPFGHVLSGTLQLRGRLIETTLLQDHHSWDHHSSDHEPSDHEFCDRESRRSYYLQYADQVHSIRYFSLQFDVSLDTIPEEILPGETLFCLLIANEPSRNHNGPERWRHCLALKKVHGTTYKRVGRLVHKPWGGSRVSRFEGNGIDWFENAPVATVIIK